jgi:hypothetical protein
MPWTDDEASTEEEAFDLCCEKMNKPSIYAVD